MLKKMIFALVAGLSGFAALFSLWGALYWRSESMRQLPREEIDRALYDYHAWLYIFIVSGVVCIIFSFLLARSRRLPKENL
jgi:hypothetical protein